MSSSWVQYFDDVLQKGPSWMDYSNERVQLQTFGAVIDAASGIAAKRVLDVGCGRGQLSLVWKALGAREVVGIDQAPAGIARLQREHPEIAWRLGDFTDSTFVAELGRFDIVCFLEVLQYLPVSKVLGDAWRLLEPGGRILAMFPYESCPIVQRTAARFDGKFVPPSLAAIVAWTRSVTDLGAFGLRGLTFQEDQRVTPYALGEWRAEATFPTPPNRIQLVVQKSDAR